MPHVERSILVHYSAEQMFHLVADVQSYPQFLPWCGGADIAAGDDRDGPHEGRRLIRGRRRLGLTPGKTPPTTACA